MIKKKLKKVLVEYFHAVINWFYENYIILNTGKCHYMCMGKDVCDHETLQILSQQTMINSKEVDISGIIIDQKLSFHQHIKSISKKSGQKLGALLRISPYLEDKKIMYNAMIKSQFNYCPLVLMFCHRK